METNKEKGFSREYRVKYAKNDEWQEKIFLTWDAAADFWEECVTRKIPCLRIDTVIL